MRERRTHSRSHPKQAAVLEQPLSRRYGWQGDILRVELRGQWCAPLGATRIQGPRAGASERWRKDEGSAPWCSR
eukprot:12308319-Alexandrium_andersonii.AAC.1